MRYYWVSKFVAVLLLLTATANNTALAFQPAPGPPEPVMHGQAGSWGKWLNAKNQIPAKGFKAIYFDRDNPSNRSDRIVDSIVFDATLNQFPISPQKLSAYWVGRLHFDRPTTRQISIDQSWARTRVLINGNLVFEAKNSAKSFTHHFTAGNHIIEVEYSNSSHTASYKVALHPIVEFTPISYLRNYLSRTGLAKKTLHFVSLYESDQSNKTVNVTLSDGNLPSVVWLNSYHAVNWEILNPQQIKAVIISSYTPTSLINLPSTIPVFYVKEQNRIYHDTKRCRCTTRPNGMPSVFHCEDDRDLLEASQQVFAMIGMPIQRYFIGYSASGLTTELFDANVVTRITNKREENTALERQCK